MNIDVPDYVTTAPCKEWGLRELAKYACAWCDQSLDEAAKGNCGAIYDERRKCHWRRKLKGAAQGQPPPSRP